MRRLFQPKEPSMDEGRVHCTVTDRVAVVVFDRPAARNAMTWAMYQELQEICSRIEHDSTIQVAVFRGAGKEAFVAGTDIAQFQAFSSGDDGVAYEAAIETVISRLERLPIPTLAVIEGYAVGGGLLMAAACDLRIATPQACFGVPVARTLGNCLSLPNLVRLVAAFGLPRVKRMLLLADMIGAEEAQACGFVTALAEPQALDDKIAAICRMLASHAPVTMRVTKEGLRRLVGEGLPADEDLLRLCYGSRDFHEGVAAFVARRKPTWEGR
jgi:enoyl-CoA hydratase